ncbi:hypothetical protein ACIA2T_04380 [Amycolatopsis japonica]|uniref:hypothetical protein n=1 Tax=Amycolatopsis japonica TaxID=208439 RepID=UPI0037B31622
MPTTVRVQGGEGLLELLANYAFLVYEEAMEQRLIQKAPLLVVTPAIELLRVRQQGEAELDQTRGLREVLGRFVQPLTEPLPLTANFAKLLLDRVLRKSLVSAGC